MTQAQPNSTPQNSTATVTVGTDGVQYSWSFQTDATVWTNYSNSTTARWDVAFQGGSTASSSYYSYPGWQATNDYSTFDYDRWVQSQFKDYITQQISTYFTVETVWNWPDF